MFFKNVVEVLWKVECLPSMYKVPDLTLHYHINWCGGMHLRFITGEMEAGRPEVYSHLQLQNCGLPELLSALS